VANTQSSGTSQKKNDKCHICMYVLYARMCGAKCAQRWNQRGHPGLFWNFESSAISIMIPSLPGERSGPRKPVGVPTLPLPQLRASYALVSQGEAAAGENEIPTAEPAPYVIIMGVDGKGGTGSLSLISPSPGKEHSVDRVCNLHYISFVQVHTCNPYFLYGIRCEQ